jgi:hypothetical protein
VQIGANQVQVVHMVQISKTNSALGGFPNNAVPASFLYFDLLPTLFCAFVNPSKTF